MWVEMLKTGGKRFNLKFKLWESTVRNQDFWKEQKKFRPSVGKSHKKMLPSTYIYPIDGILEIIVQAS